jgi:hypothetical protein
MPRWWLLPVLPPTDGAGWDAHAAPRRIVLVTEGGEPVVLATPAVSPLHAELRRQMANHPGQRVCGEWLSPRGWVRFVEGG